MMKKNKYNHKLFFSILLFIMMFFCTAPCNVSAVEYINSESTSLIEWMMNGTNLQNGYYALKVNDTTYNIHLYVLEGDQVWTSNQTFGDTNDIGTSAAYAQNMVAVLVKGNLTVETGVTVTAVRSNYGGPKGLFLYVAGTLTNNGTITMTQRGAYAAGQNVYLWRNEDGSYEYVPATGGSGGAKRTGSGGISTAYHGNVGGAGSARRTGGGGSGGMIASGRSTNSGAGGAGTSYSGGAGGGGAYYGATAGAGSSVGGAGGKGAANSQYTYGAGGGAGNPIGACVSNCSAATYGTGGLMIIYGNSIINNGTISSTGSKGGNAYRAGGGGSGGGSINIFYTTELVTGSTSAAGGGAGTGTRASSERSNGGAGGAGTVTFTQLILDEEFIRPTLMDLRVENHTMYPTFNSKVFNYRVTLDSESTPVNVIGTLTNSENIISSGVGYVDIPMGLSTHNVVVTSKVGVVQIYSIEFYRPASPYGYLQGIYVDDELIPGFNPTKLVYNIPLDAEQESVTLDAILGRLGQTVSGLGTIEVGFGITTHTIDVISEDGSNIKTYILNFIKENSTLLKSLDIGDFKLVPDFESREFNYEVLVPPSTLTLPVDAIPWDSSAHVSVTGNGYLKIGVNNVITITVTHPNAATSVYTVTVVREGVPAQTVYNYTCTKAYQTFVAPATGDYKIELWGAQGGYGQTNAKYKNRGGYGGYVSGIVRLKIDTVLYIYVGCQGANGASQSKYIGGAGGWNGGGKGGDDKNHDAAPDASGGGGGATDIRLVPTSSTGVWNEYNSLKSRIMVAAGGAGSTYGTIGFAGGVYLNKTNAYGFGYGQGGIAANSGSGGGGGGYFGGKSNQSDGGQGYGGTSYVSGGEGFLAIDESSTSNNIILTDSSIHYSGIEFKDIEAINGNSSMPSKSSGYSTGNPGAGHARITFLPLPSENNFIEQLIVKVNGETRSYTPTLDRETSDYYLTVGVNETKATISVRPEDSKAKIEGMGEVDVLAGENIYEIKITAESGDVRIYRVHITRPASDNPYPLNIVISGLVPSLCSINPNMCIVDPNPFNPDVHDYYLTVPSRIKQLYFDVEKGHDYQTVTGEGKVTLEGGDNLFTITVTSEDGKKHSVYNYHIYRDMTGDNDLMTLEILDPERDINFNPEVLEYHLSVPYDYTRIEKMNIVPDDPEANFVVEGNEDFHTGMNQVRIVVTAVNGETKTYLLNVYREKSGNTYLSNIQVKEGTTVYPLTPEYNKANLGVYKTTVPNDVTSVTIIATPEDLEKASVIIGNTLAPSPNYQINKQLSTGSNPVKIMVTAENGETEIYELNIVREKNSNPYLIDIKVSSGDKSYELLPQPYDKENENYTVYLDEGITTATITATPEVNTTTYKLLDNATIKLGTNVKRVMAIAEDGTTKTYIITLIRPANSNNYLADIELSQGKLEPSFNKEILEYTFTVENEVKSIKVTGIKEHYLSTVTGNGTYSLAVGENEIMITVKAEDGSTRTYLLTIIRKPNSNAYLKAITTSHGVLEPSPFNKETLEYTINVDYTVNSIKLTGTPEVNTTVVTGSGTYQIYTGSNFFELVTLAEDGVTSLTYKIQVIKDKSNNCNLTNIIMEEGALSPKFNKNVVKYTVHVPYEVTKGTFHVTLEDSHSNYEISGEDYFEVGENIVTIKVTAENGATKEYIITVIRHQPAEFSNFLLTLSVNKGTLTPVFDKNIMYYEVTVPYSVDSILVSAKAEDPTCFVKGTGTYALNVGENLAVVTVEGADGTSRDYQIVITREQNDDARLSALAIAGHSMNPTFNRDTYEYSLSTTDYELVFSKITTVDPNASYEITGNSFSEVGDYVVTIKVTAANGITTKEYILNVKKTPSNNNNLANLWVEDYEITPVFNKITTLYRVTVPNGVNSVTIGAIAEDPESTITGDGPQALVVGENQLVVEVTSPSGKVKAYTILVTREGSNNNYIESLELHNGTLEPDFTKENQNYSVTVPYEIEELDLSVFLEDENASYVIIDNNLSVGENNVKIVVTAENGETRTYTIHVTREDIISALLKDLKAKNYALTPEFNSYIMTYDILVDYEITSLDLTIIPLDKGANYTVTGNGNFTVGSDNQIVIEVTARDKVTKEKYILNVTRQAYSNTFLDYLYTSEGDVTPLFDREILSYYIEVPNRVTSIELFAEAIDKSATVTGVGAHNLQTGDNVFPITVTTTSGIKRTYWVTVHRQRDTYNYLTTLTVRRGSTIYDLTPSFDPTVNNYVVTVPAGTPNITIEGTTSPTAKITGLGTFNLVAGENVFTVQVMSESGVVNTYTIKIYREISSNNFLTDLIPSIGELEPPYSYFETEYTLNLDSAASVLSFTYTTEDANATVTGTESLVVPDGVSIRKIVVTAEDGSQRTYTITVIKERTDNAKLKSLSVAGFEFKETFDPDLYVYHLVIPNSKQALLSSEVTAIPQDPNAKVVKSGNINVSAASETEFLITVTAPDGFTKQDYRIFVIREPGSDHSLLSLKVTKGYLETAFSPNVYEYSWKIPKNMTEILDSHVIVTATDPNSIIGKTERIDLLGDDELVFVVRVEAQDGSGYSEYRLNISYDLSTDATLASLEIDKGYYTPEFNPHTYVYDVYEYIDETEIFVTAKPSSESSIVTSGNGTVYIPNPETTHQIFVQAEDGTVEVYTLLIHKTIEKVIGLADLGLNGLEGLECIGEKCLLTPDFEELKTNYSIKVPYEYTDLDLQYVKKSEQQTVKIKIGNEYITDYSLPVGKTTVIVEVYDGVKVKTIEYIVVIERCKSNNNYLKLLEIEGYELEPDFNKTIQEYTIEVGNDIDSVSVKAEPELAEALVQINGYNYLQEGLNDITIYVTAPDGSIRTYIVHVIKLPLNSSYIRNIYVSTGVDWPLTPKFSRTTYEYTVRIPGIYDTVTIFAIPDNEELIDVEGAGEHDISTGLNRFIVTGISKIDGTKTSYVINIIKEASQNVDLKLLEVKEGPISPEFEKGIVLYDVTVSADVDKLTITAIPEDPKATVTITGNANLVTGKNTVYVIVMSEDKTISKTYQINVTKLPDSNTKLRSLRVYTDSTNWPLDPSFRKDITDYTVEIPHDIDHATVEVIPESDAAIVIGNGIEYLDYGYNEKKITVTAEDGTITVYTVNIHRSYNLNLALLVSDVGELNPEFNKETLEYSMDVPFEVDEITFVVQPESPKVKTSGSGTYSLNTGSNYFEFRVYAEDGTEKIYKVWVNRAKDDNNYIKELNVDGFLNPAFDRATQTYTVDVREDVTSLEMLIDKMDITLESERATYTILGNATLSADNNPNQVIIRVKAENGAIRDYVLNVNLQPDSFFSNRLLSLKVRYGDNIYASLTPDFDKDINNYATTVPNSISEVYIEIVKEDEYATVTGTGRVELQLGRNVVTITVTSRDGKQSIYTVIIYREENADATLSSLTVVGHTYSPIFNKNEENYFLEVGGEVDSLDIIAIPTDPNSTVKITGHKYLSAGVQTVTILVTAPDGKTTKTYTITVTKTQTRNNYLIHLSVLGYEFDRPFEKTDQGPYTVEVGSDINSVVVDAIPEVISTIVTNDGTHSIQGGQNIISVVATSESGDARTYTIIVNKAKSSDNKLKDIIVSDGELDPEFDPDNNEYTVVVTDEVDSIRVTGIVNDPSSKVEGNDLYIFNEDDTEIYVELVVTAEDGSKNTYTVHIIKDITNSSKLKKLVVKDGELYPHFHKNITSYTIIVPYEVTSLNMECLPEDDQASVYVTGHANFKIGSNEVTITVTSRDGSSQTIYKITVIRQNLASTYLMNLEVEGYRLNPPFDKTNMYYEVTVPVSVDVVKINATAEDPMSSVSGIGYKSLQFGENRFYVTVESASGVIRSYQIVITRQESDENLLLTLENDLEVEFDPEFDPYQNEYTLIVPDKTTEVTLTGTVSENSTVTGLETVSVAIGEIEHLITVTSQSGEVNTYVIKIVRYPSTNTNLIELIPSDGELEYSNDITEYTLEVEDSVYIMSFTATPEDPDATVSGTDFTVLDYGLNVITITVTAEDGETQRIITITVIRMKDLIEIIPSESSILLAVGEEKNITYVLNPEDTSYTEVEWVSSNPKIASVDQDGNITGLLLGGTTVQIVSKHNSSIYATITVNVVNKLITSQHQTIIRETNEENEDETEEKIEIIPHTYGSEPITPLSEYITYFDNNPSTLHFFDSEDNEILDYTEIAKSYMKIKLIIEDVVYDELAIIIKGDMDGDGYITTTDKTKMSNYMLKKIDLTYLEFVSGDLDNDGYIITSDATTLSRYLLKIISSVN